MTEYTLVSIEQVGDPRDNDPIDVDLYDREPATRRWWKMTFDRHMSYGTLRIWYYVGECKNGRLLVYNCWGSIPYPRIFPSVVYQKPFITALRTAIRTYKH